MVYRCLSIQAQAERVKVKEEEKKKQYAAKVSPLFMIIILLPTKLPMTLGLVNVILIASLFSLGGS